MLEEVLHLPLNKFLIKRYCELCENVADFALKKINRNGRKGNRNGRKKIIVFIVNQINHSSDKKNNQNNFQLKNE